MINGDNSLSTIAMKEYDVFSQSFEEGIINLRNVKNKITKRRSTGLQILGIETIVPPKNYKIQTALQILDSEIRQLQFLEAEITKSVITDMNNMANKSDVNIQNTAENLSIQAKNMQPQTVDERITEESATEQQAIEDQTEIQIAAVEQSTKLLITQEEHKEVPILFMSCEPVTEEKSQNTNLQFSELQSTEFVAVEVESTEQISTEINYFEKSVVETTEINSTQKQTSECSSSNIQIIKKQGTEKETSDRELKRKNTTDRTERNTQSVRQVKQNQTKTKLPKVYLTRFDMNAMKTYCVKKEQSTDNQNTQGQNMSGQLVSETGLQQGKESINLEKSPPTKYPNCVVLLQRIYVKK